VRSTLGGRGGKSLLQMRLKLDDPRPESALKRFGLGGIDVEGYPQNVMRTAHVQERAGKNWGEGKKPDKEGNLVVGLLLLREERSVVCKGGGGPARGDLIGFRFPGRLRRRASVKWEVRPPECSLI